MSKTQVRKPVEIKIATVVAVAIILHEIDLKTLDAAMQEITGGEDDYFDDEFAVADMSHIHVAEQPIDWSALVALFKSYRLNLVAVRNATPEMEKGIREHGLSLDGGAKPRQETSYEVPAPAAAEQEAEKEITPAPPPPAPVEVVAVTPVAPAVAPPPAPAKPSAMIIDTQVRAGQRIYARGCDLIVMASVNNGAEVIADGSIHIYAPLRGRALAGASGDTGARIFTMSMEAELVSIAGMYRTFDEGLPKNLAQQHIQISLDGDRLDMRPINGTGART